MTLQPKPKAKRKNNSGYIRSVYYSGVQYEMTLPIDFVREHFSRRKRIRATLELFTSKSGKLLVEFETED